MSTTISLLDDPDFPHTTVLVETRTGRDGRGDTFAAPVTRTVIVEQGRQLVRDEHGDQVVSESTLFDAADQAELYAPGSKVTLAAGAGRPARVISAKIRELGADDGDVAHVEVALT